MFVELWASAKIETDGELLMRLVTTTTTNDVEKSRQSRYVAARTLGSAHTYSEKERRTEATAAATKTKTRTRTK